jgi:hypothetical protein
MLIEEREFTFTSAAPLRAWRLFRVRADGDDWVLSSPMYHDPDPVPWPRVATAAGCYKGHAAPAPGCRCGVYSVVRGALDSLPGYVRDTAYDSDPWAYAEVAISGRVFVDMRGVRAERAEVTRISLDMSCWPDEASLRDARRRLAERYGVPVRSLDDVPDWVVGNQRSQGPPFSDAVLDLGALDLDSSSTPFSAPILASSNLARQNH